MIDPDEFQANFKRTWGDWAFMALGVVIALGGLGLAGAIIYRVWLR